MARGFTPCLCSSVVVTEIVLTLGLKRLGTVSRNENSRSYGQKRRTKGEVNRRCDLSKRVRLEGKKGFESMPEMG
jgi:hypothetical protein